MNIFDMIFVICKQLMRLNKDIQTNIVIKIDFMSNLILEAKYELKNLTTLILILLMLKFK